MMQLASLAESAEGGGVRVQDIASRDISAQRSVSVMDPRFVITVFWEIEKLNKF